MLSDDQIDYLFQIKESKPPIPERTLRVMLKALRWSAEEIEHSLAFLKRPPREAAAAAPEPPRIYVPPPDESSLPLRRPISLKQKPFLGSPLTEISKQRQKRKHRRLTLAGAVLGALVFLAGLIIFARFAGVVHQG
ncbi:MAG: hypothetical protein HYV67_04755 [Candidatus Taylorbacteria bacterium]|nr:hypothetical protein [Candidatus Taylorbacteria bacterium]